MTRPPTDWGDKDGWNEYFTAELSGPSGVEAWAANVLRYLPFVKAKGGRTWFAGCGIDPAPHAFSALGCNVLATDLSAVAIRHQLNLASTAPSTLFSDWETAVEGHDLTAGTFAAEEQDFRQTCPDRQFDVVINRRAFQGLNDQDMHA